MDPQSASFTPLWRRLLVTALSLSVAGTTLWNNWGEGGQDRLLSCFLAAWFLVPAVLLHHRWLGSQIFVRSVFWLMVVGGAVAAAPVALQGGGQELDWRKLAAISVAPISLLLLGPRSLEAGDQRTSFSPLAFRGLLTATLVMAVADVLLLLISTIVMVHDHRGHVLPAMLPGVSTILLGTAIVGLYRLRGWGLLLHLGANLLVLTLSLLGKFESPLPWFVGGSAAAQLLLLLPVWRSIVRRTPPRPAGPRTFHRMRSGSSSFCG